MKIQPTTIVILLVSALAAFGLGWTLKPSKPTLAEDLARQQRAAPKSSLPENNTAKQEPPEKARIKANPTGSGEFAAFKTKGKISPEKMGPAVKRVIDENDPLKKQVLFSKLLGELTPENAVAAYDALRESSRGGRGGFGRGGGNQMQLLLNAWGRIDGAGAVAELTAREEKRRADGGDRGGRRDRGGWGGRDGGGSFDLYGVVSGWATTDADAASGYVDTLEDGRQKGMLTNGIVQGLLVKGVDEALDFVSSLPVDDEGRGRHMYTIASEMMEQGTSTAANWVSTIQDDKLKEGAMNRIAGSYAREDLEGAVAWVENHASGEYARGAVTEVAEQWAESDPQAVIDWATSLPETAQAGAFEEALDEWTEKDPLAASQYLEQMPDSPAKNAGIEGFATELAEEDGESAVIWAETITDPGLRQKTLSRVAWEWYRQDRESAGAWLESSDLPQETVQRIVESSDRGRGGRGDWGGRGRGR